MRSLRALVVSAALVAAVGATAPTATAGNDQNNNGNNNGNNDQIGNITAHPSVISGGGRLTVTVDGRSCGNGFVESPAFERTRLTGLGRDDRDGRGTATATVTVHRFASSGSHEITAECDGRRHTRHHAFTVIGGVRGGLGGSSESGATRTDMAIGGGLVAAAAIGGGLFWMRRRAENRA
ncbi:hypothetical protein ACFV0R_06785 [Streptomyces sp. NPDC059578]|uniref:hypothetical protein n=1 Tax=Streptomyces sp. NPDC059578 TaxID=3346874 RepID=UPI0036770072